jgi:hypothetical protein
MTTAEAERLLEGAGPVPSATTQGPVPSEGSGLYGAPDRVSARRFSTVESQAPENAIQSGDTVRIRYKMYELMTGQEVESSPPNGLLVRVGVMLEDAPGATPNRLPRAVAEVLGVARIGDQVEVVLPKGSDDIPPQHDRQSAYKLHVAVVGRY